MDGVSVEEYLGSHVPREQERALFGSRARTAGAERVGSRRHGPERIKPGRRVARPSNNNNDPEAGVLVAKESTSTSPHTGKQSPQTKQPPPPPQPSLPGAAPRSPTLSKSVSVTWHCPHRLSRPHSIAAGGLAQSARIISKEFFYRDCAPRPISSSAPLSFVTSSSCETRQPAIAYP